MLELWRSDVLSDLVFDADSIEERIDCVAEAESDGIELPASANADATLKLEVVGTILTEHVVQLTVEEGGGESAEG